MFGDARLLELLNETKDRVASTVVETVVHAVEAYAVGRPQHDDITLVALRYAGEP